MTYSKETIISLIKLNASYLADAKEDDEVVCAFDIIQSLKWKLDDIFEAEQQEKTASDAGTPKADEENNPKSEYFTSDQLSSLPLHTKEDKNHVQTNKRSNA